MQKLLVILLAAASLGTTALIALNVAAHRRGEAADAELGLMGGVVGEVDGVQPRLLYRLPEFDLVDQSARGFGSRDLLGRVWVADFVFTRCAGPCPRMTSRMGELRGVLGNREGLTGVELVTFTVDPDHDTPEVLRGYAEAAGAGEGWHFLTGDREAMWDLVVGGFKLPVARQEADAMMPFLHSEKFVLVDREGRVRGYYDGLDGDGFEALIADLERVVGESGDRAGAGGGR